MRIEYGIINIWPTLFKFGFTTSIFPDGFIGSIDLGFFVFYLGVFFCSEGSV